MGIKEDIRERVKQQVKQKLRERRAALQPEQKSIGGFMGHLKTDIVGFGKGVLTLGREAVVHPVESTKNVSSTLFELSKKMVKYSPGLLKQMGDVVANPIDTAKEFKVNIDRTRDISYEEMKILLDDMRSEVTGKVKDKPRGERILGTLGAGLFSDISKEITHPIEFAYEKPFTFGLDVLSVGGGKVLGKPVKMLGKTKKGQQFIKKIESTFVPDAKLKNAGFEKLAADSLTTKERMFNSQKKIIEANSERFEKVFKLGKKERFEFFETIDKLRRAKPGVKAFSENPKIQKAIHWWLDEQVPKIQKAVGLPKEKSITNYLHHFFPTKPKTDGTTFISPLRKGKEGYLKKSEDVAGFSKDPIVSISAIQSKIAINAIKDSFVKRTVKGYAKDINKLKNELAARIGFDDVKFLEDKGILINRLKSEFNLGEFIPKKGEFHLMPKEVADSLNKFLNPRELSTLEQGFGFFNRNWKPLATATRPRYHTRNVLGNLWNGFVLGEANIRQIPKAAWQQIGNYANELSKSTSLVGKTFKKIYGKSKINTKLIKQAIDDGVIDRGFFAMDLHDLAKVAESSDDIITAIKRYKNPAEIYRIPVLSQYLKMSFKVGEALENNARLALYMDRIRKGVSRTKAKADVNKYLFDYLTGLSETDKVIKNLIPFWSWTRFNVPLQTSAVVTQSLKHAVVNKIASPIVESMETKDELRGYLSEKEKEAGLIKVGEVEKEGKTYNKYIRTESVLPINDLTRIVDIFRFNIDSLGLNPLVGLSKRINDNLDYFGGKVEKFKGEEEKFLDIPMTGKTVEAMRIIPFLSELNKAIGGSYVDGKEPPLDIRLEQVLSPLGTTLKDQEDLKLWGILEKEKELKGSYEQGLESLYKKYLIQSIKYPEEKQFSNNVEKLENMLKSKGLTGLNLLPIKIKATKEAVKQRVIEQVRIRTLESKKETEKEAETKPTP